MSETLTFKDTIQRVGYTIINEVKVVQHTLVLPTDSPKDMRITMTKLNKDLYEANRTICRNDFAEFEDAAYELRDEYLAELNE
mgnify:CR=1 FL=1